MCASLSHLIRIVSIATALIFLSSPTFAQNYPNKTIKMVVPYPAGGGSDTLSRPLAQRLSAELGQAVIVDNKGGAGGNIAMEFVAHSAPDGYTLMLGLSPQLAVNMNLFDKVPYDVQKDFVPITLLAEGPYLLVVNPGVPVKSIKELIALAKAAPNSLNYATSGNGSGAHLAAALFTNMTGTQMVHTPYKGGGQAMAVQADVAQEDQVLRMFELIDRQWGPVSGLVNNAGVVDVAARIQQQLETVGVAKGGLVNRRPAVVVAFVDVAARCCCAFICHMGWPI